MSYIVMECHPGYVILLDEDGRFWKAANFHYQVGQTVYEPELMKDAAPEKKSALRWLGSGIVLAAACMLLVLGLRYYQNYMQPYSSVYLTINPEIKMDLNRNGIVVKLEGLNEDGLRLLEGYDGKGKDKVTAADELIDRAIAMGFLSEGGVISFSIDSPDEVLFQEYGTELRTKVTEYLEGRIIVTIEIIHYKDGLRETEMRDTAPAASEPEEILPPSETAETKPSAPATEGPSVSEPASPEPSAPSGTVGPGDSGYGASDYVPAQETAGETQKAPQPPAASEAPSQSGDSEYEDGNTDYGPTSDYGDDGGSDYGKEENDEDDNDD